MSRSKFNVFVIFDELKVLLMTHCLRKKFARSNTEAILHLAHLITVA